jgi:hypothetical protein
VCAAAAWLAIEARPDDAPIAVATPVLALLLLARDRRALAWFAAPLAVAVAASLVAKRALLGTALPLAFWAKRPHAYAGFAGEYSWNPFWFLGVFLLAAAPPIALVALAAQRRHARLLVVLLAPAAVGIAALFALNQIMGHLGRFYFPTLASIVAAAAVTSDGLAGMTPRRFVARATAFVAFALGGGALIVGAGVLYQRRADTQPLADLGGYSVAATDPLPELDSWEASERMAALAAAAPPRTRFAMSEHGLVAARAPDAVIIDVLGLHDRWFALHGFSAAELFRRRPDFIWMPHPDHTQMIRDILDSDVFWRDYDFYPDALVFGVAIRHGDDATATTLRRLFAAEYPGLALDAYRASRKMPP